MDRSGPRGVRLSGRGQQGADSSEGLLNELLVKVAHGDQRAFEALYENLAGPIYGLVYRVLRDPAQAEEVSQEVLLDVWRTAPRFDPGRGSAATWVMTIAHRRAIDRVRSASAAAAREHRIAERQPLDDDVAVSAEAQLARERVRRCLKDLTELQRESVVLAYYGGHSYRQVAGILGISLSTVKARIRTGLIRMRDCLGVKW